MIPTSRHNRMGNNHISRRAIIQSRNHSMDRNNSNIDNRSNSMDRNNSNLDSRNNSMGNRSTVRNNSMGSHSTVHNNSMGSRSTVFQADRATHRYNRRTG